MRQIDYFASAPPENATRDDIIRWMIATFCEDSRIYGQGSEEPVLRLRQDLLARVSIAPASDPEGSH